MELTTFITSSEYGTKKDTAGNVLASEGLYRAYYKSANKSSLVYEKVILSGEGANLKENHDPFAVYTVKVWVEFPAADTVSETEQPYGTAGYINVSGTVKWVDTNGGIWTAAEVITKLGTDGSVKYSLGRKTTSSIASRAVFFSADNDGTLPTGPAEGAESVSASASTTHALTGIGAANAKLTIGTFGLFVDGEAEVGGATDDLNTIHGDFTLTVEKA